MNLKDIYFNKIFYYILWRFIPSAIILISLEIVFEIFISKPKQIPNFPEALATLLILSIFIYIIVMFIRTTINSSYLAFKNFKCPHCSKEIFVDETQFICPHCEKLHSNLSYGEEYNKSLLRFLEEAIFSKIMRSLSLFYKCHFCKSKIQYLECPRCRELIDLFAEYDAKEIERKIYG